MLKPAASQRSALQYRERIGIRARGSLPAIVRQLPDYGGSFRETVLAAAHGSACGAKPNTVDKGRAAV
ncbi:MAG: hypothetical protein PHW60_02345 [Kiritimatiellae bacterium]|nr:hypothetical protein [Kiritimatiellia bacterium]